MFHEYSRHKLLTNIYRTSFIPAIDPMRTTVWWKHPWI